MHQHGSNNQSTKAIVLLIKSQNTDRIPTLNNNSRLNETVGLSRAIKLNVVHSDHFLVPKINPATLIGEGLLIKVSKIIEQTETELIIIDHNVSPGQQRNLERFWKRKVIDRTGLILEIFGERARTKEGKLQVELAHLIYQRTRLVRSWTHLERQKGGAGFLGGPGETQIEIDRRLISKRIALLKTKLKKVEVTRSIQRKNRKQVPYPTIAIVGYTNAGKSTLFNQMTKSAVLSANQVFATLDPTMRSICLNTATKVIISDTVGFISDLPHQLIAAFKATLEEVREADLILHVRDISSDQTNEQKEEVEKVLEKMGVVSRKEAVNSKYHFIEVLNKSDLLSSTERNKVKTLAKHKNHCQLMVSSITGDGTADLLLEIERIIESSKKQVKFILPLYEGKTLAWVHRKGNILTKKLKKDHFVITANFEESCLKQLANQDGIKLI